MGKYRSLLLGCGPRAVEHVKVYTELDEMELVACCDLLPERRERFQNELGIPKAYDDFETALAEVKPDIVHICTSPGRRIWEHETAAKAGVKAAIVEKPSAVTPSDLAGLDRVVNETGLKLVVNCQRRYFPQFRDGTIRRIVAEELGEVYFVRASTRGNMMGMGPHTMDLLLLFLGEEHPNQVWAAAHTINETTYQISHKAPESIMAQYWFPSGIRALFDCCPDALGTPGEESFWMHLHFDFLGSRGRLYLTQNKGYWYQTEGMAEPVHGESSWDHQGFAGQREFTRAVATWLDGGEPHLNRWELHRYAVEALLAAQKSVLVGGPVEIPSGYTDAEWTELRERLRAAS